MAETDQMNIAGGFRSWPMQRKLALAGAMLVCLALFAVILLQARDAEYRLLFGNLSSVDASSIVEHLQSRKIDYQLEDGGASILIPADKLYETRLELAGAGLPRGSGVGFEIFDKQSIGMTDFAQKINYKRALQGELARTISDLAPVEAARVHLALPSKRVFRSQQDPVTASVILKLYPGRQLSDKQVQGIINLVSGSIEGLDNEAVTVIDSQGRPLTKSDRETVAGPMTPGMLNYQHSLEQRLEERAQSLLDRALGPGNSQVRVSSKVDFSQVETTEEMFNPEAVVRSEQSASEKSGSEAVSGVPGVQSNLNGSGGSSSTSPAVRNEETVNYEISKVISHKVFPVGTIKQLSVAVLVSHRYIPEVEGTAGVWEARSQADIDAIRSMVENAIGIDRNRGDQIEVVSLPFENIFNNSELVEPEPVNDLYQYLPYAKYGLVCIALALLYVLLLRPIIKALQGPKADQPMKTVAELQAELEGNVVAQIEDRKDQEPISTIRQEAINESGAFSQIVRGWLKEG